MEVTAKTIATLGGVSYLLGLLAMNVHLNSYGVSLLGFFAEEYIAAGIWVILTLGTGAALGGLAFAGLRSAKHIRFKPVKTWWLTAAAYLLATITVIALGMEVLALLRVSMSRAWILPMVSGALSVLAFGEKLIPPSGLKRWHDLLLRQIQLGPFFPSVSTLSKVATSLLFLLFGVVVFGADVYGTIPARWGGGEPIAARLILSATNQALLKALRGQPPGVVADSTPLPVSVRVLLMTDKTVVLALDRQECTSLDRCVQIRSIALKRDAIEGIEFLEAR